MFVRAASARHPPRAQGNATLIEWLDSPIVYRADPAFRAALRDAAHRLHRPERSFHHYLHMARGNYREFLCKDRVRLKKYLYVLRPLLAALWVEQGRGPAPMRFAALVETLVTDSELRAAIDRLLARKRAASEGETGPPVPVLNAWIDRELTRLSATLPPAPAMPPSDAGELDRLLLKTVLDGPPISRALADL